MTGVKGTRPILAPLLETFLTETLFAEKVICLTRVCCLGCRLKMSENMFARPSFRLFRSERRSKTNECLTKAGKVDDWKPFQVTHSQNQPAIPAKRTLFNLVPCNRELEVAMANFLDKATDVAAFCNCWPKIVAARLRRGCESSRVLHA